MSLVACTLHRVLLGWWKSACVRYLGHVTCNASSGCGWRNGLRYGGQLRIHWISSREQPMRGGLPAWGLGEVLTTPPREKTLLRNIHKARCFLWRQNNPEVHYSPTRISGGECFYGKYHAAGKGTFFLGTWNVRSLYRAEDGSSGSGRVWRLDGVGSG